MSRLFNRFNTRGFTVAEMVVTIGIVAILSAMIMGGQSAYTSGAELRNLANNLSLSLRQAQTYGITVKDYSAGMMGSFTSFSSGFGVVFNLAESTDSYLLFVDKAPVCQAGNDSCTPPNRLYDGLWGACSVYTSECLERVTLTSRNYISKLCLIDLSGTEFCNGNTRLDITFIRPAVEAKIIFNLNEGGASSVKGARIELSSADGLKTNSVVLYTTGQISVQ